MKRIISILLSLTLIIALVPLSALATTDEDTTESTKLIKQEMLQKLHEKYGENGILEDGVEYTWDYSEIEETTSSIESGITPRWGNGSAEKVGTHNYIIEKANELAKETEGASFIPKIYLPVVKEASAACDKGYTRQYDDGEIVKTVEINKVAAIQGSQNYVATFKYLWQFTKNFNKHKEDEIISEKTLLGYIDEAHIAGRNGIPDEVRKEPYFKSMTKFVRDMLIVCYDDPKFAWDGNHIHGKRCKFIMFGIICHFIGDLYAHRTIVPKKCAKTLLNADEAEEYGMTMLTYVTSKHENTHFNNKDFENFVRYTLLKKRICTKDVHSINAVGFGELKNYKYATDDEADEKAKTDGTASMLNQNYVDKGTFYPERVEEAIIETELFLTCYSEGYDIFVIDPICVNIKNFQKYIDEIGEDYTYIPV